MAHVLCGLLAGRNPGNGRGYELDAISPIVIGGTMLAAVRAFTSARFSEY